MPKSSSKSPKKKTKIKNSTNPKSKPDVRVYLGEKAIPKPKVVRVLS